MLAKPARGRCCHVNIGRVTTCKRFLVRSRLDRSCQRLLIASGMIRSRNETKALASAKYHAQRPRANYMEQLKQADACMAIRQAHLLAATQGTS